MRFRPVLLFDKNEPVPRPLSIEALFDRRLVRQCSSLQPEGACGTDPVARPADLRTPGNHLVISRPKEDLRKLAVSENNAWERGGTALASTSSAGQVSPRPNGLGAAPRGTPPAVAAQPGGSGGAGGRLLGAGSRLYVHPVTVREARGETLYLDYWWYLHDNPAGAVKGAFCGAGLVIVGVTCFNHESDWEGLTVVLRRGQGDWRPSAVYYAEHEAVVRYEWDDLRDYWDARGELADGIRRRLTDHVDRPLAFIARGTHATYGRHCDGECRQVATDREEGDHDGLLSWVGNDTEVCLRVACLIPLPTAAGGGGSASWNAFEGPWGERHCVRTYYCDSGTPPPAPGQQKRYKDPKRYDGTAEIANGHSFEERSR